MNMLKAAFAALAFLLCACPALAQNGTLRNSDVTVLTLTAQAAATVNSADQHNIVGRGAEIGINLATVTAATVTVTVQGKDVASGTYYTLCAGAAKTATGFTSIAVYPGITPVTNTACDVPLSATWRVNVVIANNSGTAAVTGTVGASIIQ